MNRRTFLGSAAGAIFAAPLAVRAQQARTHRIGLLSIGAPDPANSARWQAFRDQLRKLGYVNNQDVVFESRWGGMQMARLRGQVTSLVDANVDILVTAGSEAALVAKQVTASIPIVMATGADPVTLGVAASLARPGGNVTGVISLIGELTGKRLEVLKELMPRASRVAFLRDPDNRSSALSTRRRERGEVVGGGAGRFQLAQSGRA